MVRRPSLYHRVFPQSADETRDREVEQETLILKPFRLKPVFLDSLVITRSQTARRRYYCAGTQIDNWLVPDDTHKLPRDPLGAEVSYLGGGSGPPRSWSELPRGGVQTP